MVNKVYKPLVFYGINCHKIPYITINDINQLKGSQVYTYQNRPLNTRYCFCIDRYKI